MLKTRKIQVTVDEEDYHKLARMARREKKKLAAVVRESIQKYSLLPEAGRVKRQALEDLFSLPPTPAPESYQKWKDEYRALKTKSTKNKSGRLFPGREHSDVFGRR